MSRRRKSGLTTSEKAAWLGIAGGILMIIAGVTGAATWNNIGEIAIQITGLDGLAPVFQVLVLLGSLGGLIVILGALFIGWKIVKWPKKRRLQIGNIMITIGAGFGLIGLMILLAIILLGDDPFGNFLGAIGIGFIGLILSIKARAMISK